MVGDLRMVMSRSRNHSQLCDHEPSAFTENFIHTAYIDIVVTVAATSSKIKNSVHPQRPIFLGIQPLSLDVAINLSIKLNGLYRYLGWFVS